MDNPHGLESHDEGGGWGRVCPADSWERGRYYMASPVPNVIQKVGQLPPLANYSNIYSQFQCYLASIPVCVCMISVTVLLWVLISVKRTKMWAPSVHKCHYREHWIDELYFHLLCNFSEVCYFKLNEENNEQSNLYFFFSLCICSLL